MSTATVDSPEMVVVVLSYNGLADTRKCLTSLHPALREHVQPLLVDNGSTDGTSEAVAAEFPWCQIVKVAQNRGPAAGNNAGIRAALVLGAKWIVLLNNDTTVHPDLFDRLGDAVRAHPEYSVLGPVIRFMNDPDVVMTDGCLFNVRGTRGFFVREEVPIGSSSPPRVVDVDMVNGCCLMISAETVNAVGLFDEAIFMYHDEADLCLRVLESGRRLGVIDHALVWHKGSATSLATGKRSIRYFDARNLWYVLGRHRGAPYRRRSAFAGRVAYFRYMYYWYSAEQDAGNRATADAVLDGICDGIAGVTGPYQSRRRPCRWPVRRAFEVLRTVHTRRHPPLAATAAKG
jgi:GT2 family glycosyltransferase